MTEQNETTTRDLAGGSDADAELSRDPGSGEATAVAEGGEREPLVEAGESSDFGGRWQAIQAQFVDSPRESVERADALVAELMQRLAQGFADERERLERQWDGGDDVSTEDLRVALTRYRSFFDRLLSA